MNLLPCPQQREVAVQQPAAISPIFEFLSGVVHRQGHLANQTLGLVSKSVTPFSC